MIKHRRPGLIDYPQKAPRTDLAHIQNPLPDLVPNFIHFNRFSALLRAAQISPQILAKRFNRFFRRQIMPNPEPLAIFPNSDLIRIGNKIARINIFRHHGFINFDFATFSVQIIHPPKLRTIAFNHHAHTAQQKIVARIFHHTVKIKLFQIPLQSIFHHPAGQSSNLVRPFLLALDIRFRLLKIQKRLQRFDRRPKNILLFSLKIIAIITPNFLNQPMIFGIMTFGVLNFFKPRRHITFLILHHLITHLHTLPK